MAAQFAHVELLLGRRVLSHDGRLLGRLEEICAEVQGNELVVTEYRIGIRGALERLSVPLLGRILPRLYRLTNAGYRVPWDKLNISEKSDLRVVCDAGELATYETLI